MSCLYDFIQRTVRQDLALGAGIGILEKVYSFFFIADILKILEGFTSNLVYSIPTHETFFFNSFNTPSRSKPKFIIICSVPEKKASFIFLAVNLTLLKKFTSSHVQSPYNTWNKGFSTFDLKVK